MAKNSGQELKIIPLGGLGEIGLNMMVFEQGDDIMVVDCGLMFPGDSLPGVDYVIPDFSYLADNADRVRGIILTHGHEDHIGALPFVLPQVKVPVWGTPLTLGLVKEKLSEHGLADAVPFHRVKAGEVIELGSFRIELIQVSHSIADSLALAIQTSIGNVIHTGDFKLDPTPIDGRRVDLAALARYGDQGVVALLSDSTNVERGGFTLSEREVGAALREIMSDAEGRVIVAMFASNIHRLQQTLDEACRSGRKAAVLGRSMQANLRIAQELGYLKVPARTIVETDLINRLPDQQIVLITTGSQGEPLSGLSRMARDEHKQVQIRPGDTVVLSSRFIPGNEAAIARLINEFYRRGAEVIYEKVSEVHVSGHASREELKIMISITRPQFFIPIHGERRHLVKHAQLAAEMGVPQNRILIAEDGDVVIFAEDKGERRGRVEAGRQVVDGTMIADSEDIVIQQRRKLARDGVLIAVGRFDASTWELLGPLELISNGFLSEDEAENALEEARRFVETELASLPGLRRKSRPEIAEQLRLSLKRHIKKTMLRFPHIIPVVVDL